MEIKLPSFFVLSLPSHLMENFLNTISNLNEFIFVYVVSIRFICDDEIYLLTDWLAGWLAGWLAAWLTDWLTYLLTYNLEQPKTRWNQQQNWHKKQEILRVILCLHYYCPTEYTISRRYYLKDLHLICWQVELSGTRWNRERTDTKPKNLLQYYNFPTNYKFTNGYCHKRIRA